MSWGIAETASEIEKIKSESADYLNGLNSCGVIDWNTYNYAFDFYEDLLMKAYEQGEKDVQPEPCDDPRADVYYLAEKIGIHRLYALVVELRGEPEPCEDAVSRKEVLKLFSNNGEGSWTYDTVAIGYIKALPSVQPGPCEDTVSRKELLKFFSSEEGSWTYDVQARGCIKALPSVTLKPDHSGDTTEMVEYDDCVSRQAVIDTARKVSSIFEGEYDTRTPYGVVLDVQDAVSKLPSVTPKRKTGKWIEYDSDEDKYNVIKCPCCKHTFTVDAYHWTDIGFVKDDFKFCPNCGSKNGDVQNE